MSSNEGVARSEFRRIVSGIQGIKMQIQPNGDSFLKSAGVWYRRIDSGKEEFWQRRLVCCVEPDTGRGFPFCDRYGNMIQGLTNTAGLISFELVLRSKASFSGVFLGIPKIGKYQDPSKKNISWTIVGFSQLPLIRSSVNGLFVFETDRGCIYNLIRESKGKGEGVKKVNVECSNSPFLPSEPSFIKPESEVLTKGVAFKTDLRPVQDTYEKTIANGAVLTVVPRTYNSNPNSVGLRAESPSGDMIDDEGTLDSFGLCEDINIPVVFDQFPERQMIGRDDGIYMTNDLSCSSEFPFERNECSSMGFYPGSSPERQSVSPFPSQSPFQELSSCQKGLMENMDDYYYIGYYPIPSFLNNPSSSAILPQ